MNSNPVNVMAINSAGELPDCSVNRATIQTKCKHSPTASLAAGISEEKFTVYPNPASSEINLEVKDGVGARLEVYSIMGELVYAETLESAHTQIDCSSFSAGLYTVTVVSDKGVISKKIIINR
jgi:hypothetical protein